MLYAILCYHDEDFVGSWSKDQDEAVMKKLAVVQERLTQQGRLGPVARLLPTTAAAALRKEEPPLVLDPGAGPVAKGAPAAGARRPLCRDQGATARLLHRRLQEPRRGARCC